MEFSKILTRFTVISIVVLFLTALVCMCIIVVKRGEVNLNPVKTHTSTQSCTQIGTVNC